MYDFPAASYDHWKTTPDEWHMPYHIRRAAEEDEWRMARRRDWFDCDEAKYEWLCDEWDELARIDAHERDPEEDDFDA